MKIEQIPELILKIYNHEYKICELFYYDGFTISTHSCDNRNFIRHDLGNSSTVIYEVDKIDHINDINSDFNKLKNNVIYPSYLICGGIYTKCIVGHLSEFNAIR